MGVAIRCVLEKELPNVPYMEGKSLAMAYCAGAPEHNAGESSGADIITLDFSGGTKPAETANAEARKGSGSTESSPERTNDDSLLAPLGPFISGDRGVEWCDAGAGLGVVRGILNRIKRGERAQLDADFPFAADDDEDLTEGVRFDLEELEEILEAAGRANVRFYLAFDV